MNTKEIIKHKPTFRNWVILFFYMTCSFFALQTASADDMQLAESANNSSSFLEKGSKQQQGKAAISNGAAGMRLQIDTQTGEFVIPSGKIPSAKLPSVAQQKMFTTSSKGLTKRPSDIPGGGESVYLQGRFMSPLVLKIGPNGQKTIDHIGNIPQKPEKE